MIVYMLSAGKALQFTHMKHKKVAKQINYENNFQMKLFKPSKQKQSNTLNYSSSSFTGTTQSSLRVEKTTIV